MVALYDGRLRTDWTAELLPSQEYNRRHLLALFALTGIPASYLDVGCGDGTMVRMARQMGVSAFGVDQLVEGDGDGFYHRNLVDRFILDNPVHLVTSFEVAEHLHESAHARLCDTLCENLKAGTGNFLVFTAAHPGQGGNGHLSERPAQYWHNEFFLRHLNYRKDVTTELALLWSHINSPLGYMAGNAMVFEK